MIRAALFDLDGTLVLTNIDFAGMKRAVLSIADEHGIDASRFADRDSLSLVRHVEEQLGPAAAVFRARALAAIVDCELASIERARAADGAIETLTWLRSRGVRIAIVTRNGRDAVRRLLERFPFVHDALLTRDDVARVKPHPLHIYEALNRLRVEPANAIMVGDHAMDIVAGRAAGVRHALAIAHEGVDARTFASSPPDALLRSFDELRAFVEEWA
jgi:phosphoglycolate phosphatase